MTCRDYAIELSDYVDGILDERSRAAVEAHLAGCDRCRFLVSDLGAIRRATMSLEPQVPSPHVWMKISAVIEERSRSPFGPWGLTWQTLAASMVALTIVAGLSWIGGRLAPPTGTAPGLAATPAAGVTSVAAEFELAEAQFTTAIAGLESIARIEQSALDMETADVLQANLTVIDGAITESRAALETDPDSRAAQESLFDALRSKLDLLQDVVALINEMRKGNPEGAARIVSGINP